MLPFLPHVFAKHDFPTKNTYTFLTNYGVPIYIPDVITLRISLSIISQGDYNKIFMRTYIPLIQVVNKIMNCENSTGKTYRSVDLKPDEQTDEQSSLPPSMRSRDSEVIVIVELKNCPPTIISKQFSSQSRC